MALLNLINNCTNLAQYEEIGNSHDAIPIDENATDVNANISLNSCDETQQSILTKYSFATEGVGLFTVAVVGVLANILSIAVLAEKTMKTQITALLITLAVFDTVFLFCCIPVFCISSVRGFVGYLNTCVYSDGKCIVSNICIYNASLYLHLAEYTTHHFCISYYTNVPGACSCLLSLLSLRRILLCENSNVILRLGSFA